MKNVFFLHIKHTLLFSLVCPKFENIRQSLPPLLAVFLCRQHYFKNVKKNVSNARANISKAIRSLKKTFFVHQHHPILCMNRSQLPCSTINEPSLYPSQVAALTKMPYLQHKPEIGQILFRDNIQQMIIYYSMLPVRLPVLRSAHGMVSRKHSSDLLCGRTLRKKDLRRALHRYPSSELGL